VNPVLLKARIGASLEKKRLRDQQKELVRRFRHLRRRRRTCSSAIPARRPPGAGLGDVRSDIRGFTSLRRGAARPKTRSSCSTPTTR
jgi:hypothetical protein